MRLFKQNGFGMASLEITCRLKNVLLRVSCNLNYAGPFCNKTDNVPKIDSSDHQACGKNDKRGKSATNFLSLVKI